MIIVKYLGILLMILFECYIGYKFSYEGVIITLLVMIWVEILDSKGDIK